MTAPMVTTVTKQPGGPAGRSRLQRALLMAALLLPLLLAITLLIWMAVPRAGEGHGRPSWVDGLFGSGEEGGVKKVEVEEDICSLPNEIGPCRGAMPRYFYSSASGSCEAFLYGGCDGNANNFETIDACTSRCGGQGADAAGRKVAQHADCSLPKKVGPCRGAMLRYFYSTDSDACEQFLYGGCDGNANNFETRDECDSRCGGQETDAAGRKVSQRIDCSLPKEVGPCRGAKPRFFYNTGSDACEQFLYGGCDGNTNNFETMDECASHCGGSERDQKSKDDAAICKLPKVTGRCKASIPRYFFDVKTSTCKEFAYGGCGGNGNNFETLHDCEKMCSSSKSGGPSPSDCSSEPDGGICMAYMERYAYHPDTGKCEQFVYGGCGGNGNRYSSRQECEEHCAAGGGGQAGRAEQKEGADVDCSLPKEVGPCRGAKPRFFFNTETNACEQFLYGGCDGNSNNFETIDECASHCKITGEPANPEHASEHDTRVCGVPECPMDCGLVGREGDCLLCSCGDSPLAEPEPEPEPLPAV